MSIASREREHAQRQIGAGPTGTFERYFLQNGPSSRAIERAKRTARLRLAEPKKSSNTWSILDQKGALRIFEEKWKAIKFWKQQLGRDASNRPKLVKHA